MPETPGTPRQEIKLFYCYAHQDKALRAELQTSLASLQRKYQLTNWYDRDILLGEKWKDAIDKNLSTADVILLLISPHFIASDYCYSKEMPRALERHEEGTCKVIPIILRPTFLDDAPFNDLQMLPTDAKPITIWHDRDEAFLDVARGIDAAIKNLLTSLSRKTQQSIKQMIQPLAGQSVPASGRQAVELRFYQAYTNYNNLEEEEKKENYQALLQAVDELEAARSRYPDIYLFTRKEEEQIAQARLYKRAMQNLQ